MNPEPVLVALALSVARKEGGLVVARPRGAVSFRFNARVGAVGRLVVSGIIVFGRTAGLTARGRARAAYVRGFVTEI